jgi:predicted permease
MIPRPFAALRRALRPIPRPRDEADDEIRFHLEMRAAEMIARGTPPDEAREAALRYFGDADAVRSELDTIDTWENRRMSLLETLDGLRTDLGYAVRTLRRQPALVAGIVATFALAIGANAAMFGLVRQLLLAAPPGIADAEHVARARVVYISEDGDSFRMTTTSYPAFRALQSTGATFAAVAATRPDTIAMGRAESATEVASIAATADYFAVMQTRPSLGRFFGPSDDAPPGGAPVVVLSHAFWKRKFHGDAAVLGTDVVLDDEPFTIIGVAPPGFNGDALAAVDVFIPLSAAFRNREPSWRTDERLNVVSVVARLRPGVMLAGAQRAATATLRTALDGRRDNSTATIELESVVPGASARQTPQARIALWLSGVSLVVLLIATANVATLLLLRALARRREIAVRIALGVGRARLARQLLTESLLLAAAGAAVGLVVARWLAGIIRVTLLPGLAPSERFVEGQVLVATAVVAIAAGVLAGLAPLAQLARRTITAELNAAGGRGSAQRSAMQRGLVGLQVALCTVLLVGAGVFVRSLQRVQSQDLGFDTSRLLLVELDFRRKLGGFVNDQIHVEAAARLALLPGVSGATVVQAMPFGFHHIPPISVPGLPTPPTANGQLPILYGATPEYLRLMNVKLLEGRLITARDTRESPLVVLVNESMARETWPGQSAIGKCIRAGHGTSFAPSPLAVASLPCREVVGVVRDSRARSLRPVGREASLMQYYIPFPQLPGFPAPDAKEVNALLVGVTGDVDHMVGAVQRSVQGGSSVPVYARVRPYQDLLDPQLRPWQLGATLFSAFGVLALGIAAVGLFGVVSYVVAQRTKEIGVRLALGASRATAGRLVITDAVRMVAGGVAVGIVVALIAAPAVQSLLFATSAREAVVMIGAAAALLSVTVVAAAFPAWRASRVSPMIALRNE